MRKGLILAALFLVLSSTATILAFTSGGDDSPPSSPVVSNEAPTELNFKPAAPSVQDPPALPPADASSDSGCNVQNDSGPGYNRSTVICNQQVTSPDASSGAAQPPVTSPSLPETPALPQVTVPSQPSTPAQPQTQAAPQDTNPGDNDPACVTDHKSGDGWETTTVECNRRSESAGSSASSSSVVTSSSSVSVSSSNSSGTP